GLLVREPGQLADLADHHRDARAEVGPEGIQYDLEPLRPVRRVARVRSVALALQEDDSVDVAAGGGYLVDAVLVHGVGRFPLRDGRPADRALDDSDSLGIERLDRAETEGHPRAHAVLLVGRVPERIDGDLPAAVLAPDQQSRVARRALAQREAAAQHV